MNAVTRFELQEFIPKLVSQNDLSIENGQYIWNNYGKQIAVEFPSPKTGGLWQFTSQGWVGYIPLLDNLGLNLVPKVPLSNLFGMLEYAYRLRSFKFLTGLVECDSLQDFYSKLAKVLADSVLKRNKRGYYRDYREKSEDLPYISGKITIDSMMRSWTINKKCEYHELISDIEDNQILAWTLHSIARNGMCAENVLPTVTKAYRSLSNYVTLVPFRGKDCIGRMYNRLNQDYQPLHALCRFFLDQSGPSHREGDNLMLPFLVDMARLYELFVAEWLKENLPNGYEAKAQERVDIGSLGEVSFDVDLVIYDPLTGLAQYVIDTKYKSVDRPSTSDIAQVVAYAVAKQAKEAILLYPMRIKPFCEYIGDIRVRTLTFDLGDNLQVSGRKFIQELTDHNTWHDTNDS